MYCILALFLLTSCQALPEFFKSAEEVLTDGVLQCNIQVDREAFLKDTNLEVSCDVKVINRDAP